jgi:hypothetical protein
MSAEHSQFPPSQEENPENLLKLKGEIADKWVQLPPEHKASLTLSLFRSVLEGEWGDWLKEAAAALVTVEEKKPDSDEDQIPKALFQMGTLVATPGAIEALEGVERNLVQLLARHVEGDWGNLDEHDIRENELSLIQGYRLFSAYNIEDEKFYVITEWNRSVTTVLRPDEY